MSDPTISTPVTDKHTGITRWNRFGVLHREDGPAIEYPDGSYEWLLNGKHHRIGGPASIVGEGNEHVPTRRWYKEGQLHREDGPAVEDDDGTQLYYRDGKLHREDGPARILPNYRQQDHWLNGNRVSGEQFVARTQKAEPKAPKGAKATRVEQKPEPKPEPVVKEVQVFRPVPTPKVQQPTMAEQGGFGF